MSNLRRPFNQLTTNSLALRMRPVADAIYGEVFPGCRIERLEGEAGEGHPLDKELGIDLLLHLSCGAWLSVQEKIRSYKHLQNFGDFTQEYKNAAGTEYESDGEWFKLGAQLYFYGWANEQETEFEKWNIYNVADYKMLVESSGGIEMIGRLQNNRAHGRASFYGIPLSVIAPASIANFERPPALLPAPKKKGRRISTTENLKELWPAVLMRIKNRVGVTAVAYLHDARPVALTDDALILEFSKEFHYAKASEASGRLPFEATICEVLDRPRRLVLQMAQKPLSVAPMAGNEADNDPDVIEWAQSKFGAEIMARSGKTNSREMMAA